jgi:hypothetical protein
LIIRDGMDEVSKQVADVEEFIQRRFFEPNSSSSDRKVVLEQLPRLARLAPA